MFIITSLRKFINKCSESNEKLQKHCKIGKNLLRSRLELFVFIKKVSFTFSQIASGSVLVNPYEGGKSLNFFED